MENHPQYLYDSLEWTKWRLCWNGGRDFVNRYLRKFTTREDNEDFAIRRELTYPSMFATSQIIDIANSVYDRMAEIKRKSVSKSYLKAITGLDGGVDLTNANMNYFMGIEVLQELLFMKRVGVYVDMPNIPTNNLKEASKLRPYVYVYRTEQILNWKYGSDGKLDYLLLNDVNYDSAENNVIVSVERTREYIRSNGQVYLKITGDDNQQSEMVLNIPEIPFVIFELTHSLMSLVADHQIALMNIESSDINFITKANFPIYVEMFDPQYEQMLQSIVTSSDPNNPTEGSDAASKMSEASKIKAGSFHGKRFAKTVTEYPTFIAPPPDTIKLSMEKQEQIKKDITLILNKSTANLKSTRSSGESKQVDISREEQGLTQIGFELSRGEHEILRFWLMYENKTLSDNDIILYPTVYKLKDDDTRVNECKQLNELKTLAPSQTYRRELAKRAVNVLFSGKISDETLKKIEDEIDSSIAPVDLEYKAISSDIIAGVLSPETGALIRGYPEGEAERAKQAHAERAARILLAQQSVANRGAADLADDPASTKVSRDDSTLDTDPSTKVRGES